LLVSFARSGSSPESVAAVELTDQLVTDAHHLVLCCNPDSPLVRTVHNTVRDGRCLLMPAETLDRSFAMTSSMTSMVLSALSLFVDDAAQAAVLEATTRDLLATPLTAIGELVGEGLDRAIFLGSGGLTGAAKEAALKCLELSAGRSATLAESSLGLRHGPKFAVAKSSLVIILTGSDPHTRNYDLDIAAELERDGIARAVVRMDLIDPFAGVSLDDPWLGLAYLVWCQLLAYRNAIALGVSPDNPSPNGDVNRVVQGVTIHPFAVGDE
jgi:tagatose-6-phosphate ketose/aldose isomerase